MMAHALMKEKQVSISTQQYIHLYILFIQYYLLSNRKGFMMARALELWEFAFLASLAVYTLTS